MMTATGDEIDLEGRYAMAFGTPIASYLWENSDALNREIQERVLEFERNSTGLTRSNVGSWHSDPDLFTGKYQEFNRLSLHIQKMTGAMTKAIMVNRDPKITSVDYLLEGWANITRNGGYNTVHNHPNSMWSGVYYVSAGMKNSEPPQNGQLELLDPRAGVNMMNIKGTIMEGRYLIDPIPGLMVMFPSWLSHFVHPFFGTGERISIAFNVTGRVPDKASS